MEQFREGNMFLRLFYKNHKIRILVNLFDFFGQDIRRQF